MRGILGADIFINLLLVFIITTGLLFMNTNKVSQPKLSAASDRTMPKNEIAKSRCGWGYEQSDKNFGHPDCPKRSRNHPVFFKQRSRQDRNADRDTQVESHRYPQNPP
jgi:hypothetical protein